jgi:hypothetical protein
MLGFLPRSNFQDKSFILSTAHSAEKVPSENRTSFRVFQILHTIVCQINNHPNLFSYSNSYPGKPQTTLDYHDHEGTPTRSTPNHRRMAYQISEI